MRRTRLAIVVLLSLLSLDAQDAAACLCGGLGNPCASLWFGDQSPTVFEGTVESIEPRVIETTLGSGLESRVYQREMREVRFRDVRSLLGERATVVLTGSGGGDCGYERFRVGDRFVVHAMHEPEGLTTGTCSFTAPVAEAREILDYIAGLSLPSPGARVNGRVVLAKREFVGSPSVSNIPLAGVALQLEGPVRRTAASDGKGAYAFEGLPPGRYEITLATERADLLHSGPVRQSFVLGNVHACATPYAEFYANGSVEGVVVDVDGRPVANTRVNLRAADVAGHDQVHYDDATTDIGGRYRFQALGAGRYVVGVNLQSGIRDDSPWAATTATGPDGAATIVDLQHAEHAQVAPITVRKPQSIAVTGRLALADGRPIPRVAVRAFGAGEGFRSFGDSLEVTTDDDGRFAFTLGDGQAYRISSWLDTGHAELDTVVRAGMHVALMFQPRR